MAAYFGKPHDYVLKKIDSTRVDMPTGGPVTFYETPSVDPQNGQTYRSFDMSRDGFTLLAMGFTGKKAPFLDAA